MSEEKVEIWKLLIVRIVTHPLTLVLTRWRQKD